MSSFTIARFDGSSFGERYCPYDMPENQMAEGMDDAREKAMFSFTDGGVSCTPVGDDCFNTDDGEEYRVFLS